MNLVILSNTSKRVPRQFLEWWCDQLSMELPKRHQSRIAKSLTLYFVNPKTGKKLNSSFRKRTYLTDVLSFEPIDELSLGELAISLETVERQAKDHDLHQWEELGYVVTHGVLHLLGYDHETNERDAKVMFRLQDRIFNNLCDRYELLKKSGRLKKGLRGSK